MLFLIGAFLILRGLYFLVKGIYKLGLATYYTKFANENQIDEGFKKHVVKESEEYKEFESKFDEEINYLINPKNFEL